MRRLFFAIPLLSIACSSAEVPDCPAGTKLNNGACRPQCAGDEECTLNEQCFENVCIPYVGVSDAGMIDVGMVSCTKDQDCPNGPSGPWAECAFDDACDMMGIRSRTVRRGVCNAGLCGLTESTQNMACPRSTDGQTCGDPQVSPWSACESTDECAIDGVMRRMVGTPICNQGNCEVTGTSEQQPCMRDTAGLSCGPGKIYNDWEECTFPDVCAPGGVRARRVDTYVCMNARCDFTSEQELDFQTCVQPSLPDGAPCGNDLQCCSGGCTQKNDPSNCNVCGQTCAPGQGCSAIVAGDGTMQWACECREPSECHPGYGMNAECVGLAGLSVCACQCTQSDCSTECIAGSCHTPLGLSYCGY